MDITLIEARELYRQGGLAKEVALRAFPEEEIVNDYTLMVALPTSLPANCSDLYSKLSVVYKFMSRGRKVELTSGLYYVPEIVLARPCSKPNHGTYAGKIMIDDLMFNIYINTARTMWEGKLGFENDGVYCGSGLLSNHWIFKGILLWATALTIMLFIGGIDSIVDKGLGVTLAWIVICTVLYYLCHATLSIRELYTLSGYKLFYKLMN